MLLHHPNWLEQVFILPKVFEPLKFDCISYRRETEQGPVVQSIVSLTNLLRGQLIKCFTTLQPNTLKFFI